MPVDDEPPVRLAIVGAGGAVSGIHVPVLQQLARQFTVTAICSRSRDSAERVAAQAGAAVASTDADAVLARADIDAVLIAVPIGLSASLIRRALIAGKHVLAEKPLAASVDEARELIEASRRNPQLVAMVGANTRYAAYTQALRESIWSGEIGEPRTAYYHSIAHVDLATQSAWRARPTYMGGYLLDGGVHSAATLRALFGEPTRVAAIDELYDAELGGNSGITLHVRTEREVQLVCTFLVTSCPAAVPSTVLNVYGTNGSVCVSTADGQMRMNVSGASPRHWSAPHDAGYRAQLQDFFTAIRSRTPPHSSFEEGLLDLLWIHRALDSAAHVQLR